MRERKKLGEILRDLQVLTDADIARVLEAVRRRRDQTKFGQVARDMGLLRDEHILAALAVQMQMFPGIQDWSLSRLLDCLQQPALPQLAGNRPPGQLRGGPGFTRVLTNDSAQSALSGSLLFPPQWHQEPRLSPPTPGHQAGVLTPGDLDETSCAPAADEATPNASRSCPASPRRIHQPRQRLPRCSCAPWWE